MSNAISVVRGDAALIACPIMSTLNPDKPFDLTLATEVLFTVRKSPESTVALAKTLGAGVTIDADPETGIVYVSIDGGDTSEMSGIYLYDIEVTAGGKPYTVVLDKFVVTKDISA